MIPTSGFSRFGSLTLVVSTLLLGVATPCAAQLTGAPGKPNPIQLLTKGVQHFRANQIDQAAATFEELRAIDAYNPTVHYYLGLCHAESDRIAEAVAAFGESIATGHPDVDSLLVDKTLAPLLAEKPKLAAGVRALIEKDRRRRAGTLDPFALKLSGQSRAGATISLSDLEGAPVLVVFLDAGKPASVDAGLTLQGLIDERPRLRVLAVVNCSGKDDYRRRAALDDFVSEHGFTFATIIATRELERSLRPFRGYPTLVGVDKKGMARTIVEGPVAMREDRMIAAIDGLVAADTPKKPQPPKKPESNPKG